jgi:hypothetical protein
VGEEGIEETIVRSRCSPFIQTIRTILIIGAAACCVVGLKWMYWTFAYPAPAAIPIAVFAFVPIILIAPRSQISKRPVFIISLGLIEAIIIAGGLTLELR